jgi:TRAP-type uncharacterized transport system substrate-binding protein
MNRRSLLQSLSLAAATPLLAAMRPSDVPSDLTAPSDPVAAENANIIGLATAGLGGTFIQIGSDLMNALDGPNLRILPYIGKGSVQNMKDLLWIKHVDVAIINADAMAWAIKENLAPNINKQIAYICGLYQGEVHLLARPEITDISQLAGKKINGDVDGSGNQLTTEVVFDRLGISVDIVPMPTAVAIQRMKDKELWATCRIVGKPMRMFRDLPAGTGFHFLPIPYTDKIGEVYTPAELDPSDYPSIFGGSKEIVHTIACGCVLAVYNWTPANQDRFRRVATFTREFFAKFPMLLHPPFNPKWREVNLASVIPGWTRFSVAADMIAQLEAAKQSPSEDHFKDFLSRNGMNLPSDQEKKLWSLFQTWAKYQ